MAGKTEDFKFEVVKDFGAFGEGKWQKHLTLTSFCGNEPKLDIRAWNEDLTKMSSGVTLDSADAYDLLCLLEEALEDEGEGKKDE